jgi:hypothetical protein
VLLLRRPELWPRDIIAAQAILAWAQLVVGDVTMAETVIVQACVQARAGRYAVTLLDALRVLALVLIRQERCGEATDAISEGLALARSIPYPYAGGRLQQVYGQLLLAQGEIEPARERLGAALATFRRLGARLDAERTAQWLDTVSLPA